MKKLLLYILVFVCSLQAFSQQYEWTKTFGGTNNDWGKCIMTDALGNVYLSGYFWSSTDLDPGLAVDEHFANGTGTDSYIVKLDSTGNYLWAKTFGGTGDEYVKSITTDNSGNIYIGGYFTDTADFDPGPAVDEHISIGSTDPYILKLDSEGNYQWVRTFGGTNIDEATSITTDHLGNIYIGGSFGGTVDFDPGPGIYNRTANFRDSYIVKLDSLGDYQWVKTFGGMDVDEATSTSIDQWGNVYIVGTYRFTVDFDPGPGVDEHISNGNYDAYILKLDSSGDYQWAKTFGGTSVDNLNSISIDQWGNIYVGGKFANTVDFNLGPGVDEHISNGNTDGFIIKLDSLGDYQWAKTFGGTSGDNLNSIITDKWGNIYVGGNFQDTADFNPGPGVDEHFSNGAADAYFVKLDSLGNYQWAKTFGGTSADYLNSISTDQWGNSYAIGEFPYTVDFDPGTEVDNYTSNGYDDVFIIKFKPCQVSDTTLIQLCPGDSVLVGGVYRKGSGVYLDTTLVATNCCDSLVMVKLEYLSYPLINAGEDQNIIDGGVVSLDAELNNVSGVTWSTNGTGSFDNPNLGTTTYTPSAADISVGAVELMIEGTGSGSCGDTTDKLVVTLTSCDLTLGHQITNDNTVDFKATLSNPKVLGAMWWDYGDGNGNVGKGFEPRYTFDNTGSYPVTAYFETSDQFCTDTQQINVNISSITEPSYSISGTVYAGSTPLDTGFAVLFKELYGFYILVDNKEIGSIDNGGFLFNNLTDGNYLLYASPGELSAFLDSYQPTFVGDVDKWEESTIVTLSGANVTDADITLKALVNSDESWDKGTDRIGGSIAVSDCEETQSNQRDLKQGQVAAEAAIVKLYNSNNELVAHTSSNQYGEFFFEGISSGLYKIEIEYVGTGVVVPYTYIVDGDSTTHEPNADFDLKRSCLTSINDNLQTRVELFPNPVNDIINLLGILEDTQLVITNNLGQVVQVNSLSNSQNTIDVSSLKPGNYILKVVGEDVSYTFSWIKL